MATATAAMSRDSVLDSSERNSRRGPTICRSIADFEHGFAPMMRGSRRKACAWRWKRCRRECPLKDYRPGIQAPVRHRHGDSMRIRRRAAPIDKSRRRHHADRRAEGFLSGKPDMDKVIARDSRPNFECGRDCLSRARNKLCGTDQWPWSPRLRRSRSTTRSGFNADLT